MSTEVKVPMRATAHQYYGGRALRAGDLFEARNEGDAADLVAVGFAQRVSDDSKRDPRGTYKRRDMQARKP